MVVMLSMVMLLSMVIILFYGNDVHSGRDPRVLSGFTAGSDQAVLESGGGSPRDDDRGPCLLLHVHLPPRALRRGQHAPQRVLRPGNGRVAFITLILALMYLTTHYRT